MQSNRVCLAATVLLLAYSLLAVAQQSADVVVPPTVNFSGMLRDANGKALTGVVGVTFYLYKDQQGGTPLWIETQNVQADKSGRYSFMLGSTTSQGLPPSLFASGEARWLGVQAQGQEEQPRVMLSSVPYAMKAGDAETVGGLPASAFVLAAPSSVVGRSATSSSPGQVSKAGSVVPGSITGSGTAGFLPKFTGAATIGNSAVFQSGSSPTAKIGINTNTPTANLDVNGSANVRGNVNATGVVSASTYNIGSNPFAFGSKSNANAFLGFSGNQTMTGSGNTAAGNNALQVNTTGSGNTAIGLEALGVNTTGGDNTAIGLEALGANTSGLYNTAVGNGSLDGTTTGAGNTAVGDGALFKNTTGASNTGLGLSAGATADGSILIGMNDTFVGAGASSSTGTLTNATAIGAGSEVTENNAMVLGSINGVNGAAANVNVGIGDTAPAAKLTVSGNETTPNGLGAAIKLSNTGPLGGTFYLRAGAFGTNTPSNSFSIGNDTAYLMTITPNGVGLGNTFPIHPLQMGDGAYEDGGTWTNSSDRNAKQDFAEVDGVHLLAKLNTIPIETWKYRAERGAVRHLGPVAQDFYAAFGLGRDNTHISTVDEGGVALAAAQELYRESLRLIDMVKQQQRELALLRAQTHILRNRLAHVEQSNANRGRESHTAATSRRASNRRALEPQI